MTESQIPQNAWGYRILMQADVVKVMSRGSSARIETDIAAKFKPGARVSVLNINPTGHTRAPRYVRGRVGEIDRDHGVFIFPDSHAQSGDKNPQHCYSVRFSARELWGKDANAHDVVYVDLWDDYLEAADAS